MDTSCMAQTLGNVSMMVHGLERLQNAARQREVNIVTPLQSHQFNTIILFTQLPVLSLMNYHTVKSP